MRRGSEEAGASQQQGAAWGAGPALNLDERGWVRSLQPGQYVDAAVLTEGARADVLATANASTMRQARDAGLIEGEPVVFTANRLVIVTREKRIRGPRDLVGHVVGGVILPLGELCRAGRV